jgi:hypothetical protein
MKRNAPSLPFNYGGSNFAPPKLPDPVYRGGTSGRRNAMSDLSHRWFQTVQDTKNEAKKRLESAPQDGSFSQVSPALTEPRPRRELSPPSVPPLPSHLQKLPSLLARLPFSHVEAEELFLCTLLLLLGQAGADHETLLLIAVLLFWN